MPVCKENSLKQTGIIHFPHHTTKNYLKIGLPYKEIVLSRKQPN